MNNLMLCPKLARSWTRSAKGLDPFCQIWSSWPNRVRCSVPVVAQVCSEQKLNSRGFCPDHVSSCAWQNEPRGNQIISSTFALTWLPTFRTKLRNFKSTRSSWSRSNGTPTGIFRRSARPGSIAGMFSPPMWKTRSTASSERFVKSRQPCWSWDRRALRRFVRSTSCSESLCCQRWGNSTAARLGAWFASSMAAYQMLAWFYRVVLSWQPSLTPMKVLGSACQGPILSWKMDKKKIWPWPVRSLRSHWIILCWKRVLNLFARPVMTRETWKTFFVLVARMCFPSCCTRLNVILWATR